MSVHNCSVFKNSCIKTPIHPASRLPTPCYERRKSRNAFKEMEGLSKSLNNLAKESMEEEEEEEEENGANLQSTKHKGAANKDNSTFMSIIDFYESIPEYTNISHLSEKEFNYQLEVLKRKQRELKSYFYSDNLHCTKHLDDPVEDKSNKSEMHRFRDTYSKTPPVRFDLKEYCDDEDVKKNVSSKAVRINSGKSSIRSGTSHWNFSDEEFTTPRKLKSGLRSKSISPCRPISPSKPVTIPKPFKMTQREEDDKIRDGMMIARKLLSPKSDDPPVQTYDTKFKANPVPLTSKIPLYKHILEEQEQRSKMAKLNSTIELQSQMKPFSFFASSIKGPNGKCLSRSQSSPNLGATAKNDKSQQFKAKPCPKNLFSNYFYQKLWEDEYFRTLNHKIRSEELLKSASLPPSMAKREKTYKGSVKKLGKKKKRKKRSPISGANAQMGKSQEFITTSTEPFEFETEKRFNQRMYKQSSSTTSSTNLSSGRPTPMPIYPAARPNLAANLRAETSRKKICEITHLDQDIVPPMRTPINKVNWGVKKSPAWKSIYFDGTNDEDISLRLATRRAEQKLRQEEHAINMELMRQRVRAAPLLLEGPTHWGPRVGKVSHDCGIEAQEKLMRCLKKSRSHSSCQRYSSKMSQYSDCKQSVKSMNCYKRHGGGGGGDESYDFDSIDAADLL